MISGLKKIKANKRRRRKNRNNFVLKMKQSVYIFYIFVCRSNSMSLRQMKEKKVIRITEQAR